ncbi:hypothetical protein KR032_004369 [Drosophila birchii]|nr:hypothetical protein KR032_004369 [Drosophila birchii]
MSQNPAILGPKPIEYAVCPYNSHHCMRPNRLAVHLMSCSLNYPSAQMVRCVFNTTHILSVEEMKTHIEKCPNRKILDNFKNPPSEPQTSNFYVESTEDWDAEPPSPTYNPRGRCDHEFVIRNPQGNPPKARREFRARERLRFMENNKF